MNALMANTPCDVLLDGRQRIGPQLTDQHCGPKYEAIYGFSGKASYDLFCANSDLPLTPYPLVPGYLKNQTTGSGNAVHLVVVDASGPQEAQLYAATMNAVLEAQKAKSTQVTISFCLTLDGAAQAYRVEKSSSNLRETGRPAETH